MHAGEASGTSALRAHPIASPENDFTGGRFPAKIAGGLRIRMGNNTYERERFSNLEQSLIGEHSRFVPRTAGHFAEHPVE